MAIEWILGFEKGKNANTAAGTPLYASLFLTGVSGGTTIGLNGLDGTQTQNVIPINDLSIYNTLSYTASTAGTDKIWGFTSPDNNKVCIGAAIKIECYDAAYQSTTSSILGLNGSNYIAFGLNGKFACLTIDGTIAATSSVDVVSDAPYSYIEVFIDKVANKAYLKVNGASTVDATLPGSYTVNQVRINEGRGGSNKWFFLDSLLLSTAVDPIGPVKVAEYFKTANITTQFSTTGSPTDLVNTRPYTAAAYRNSTTDGHLDLFSYNQLIPETGSDGVPFTSIVAVQHEIVAASAGIGNGTLNGRVRLSATDYDVSYTSLLSTTTPTLCKRIMETNPHTAAAWTRADVQGIQTGYIIAT